MEPSGVVGRFAPSPTGEMHAGNIFAALNAWLLAKGRGGSVVLRIEDLDAERSRQEYADAAMRAFEELGLAWDAGPFYQRGREEAYAAAFERLRRKAHVYPCFCSRADLAAQSAPHAQGEKAVYPGRCKRLAPEERAHLQERFAREGRMCAQRLEVPDARISFDDIYQGTYAQDLAAECGDFVLRRGGAGGFAYQLAVVVDDAAQGVNMVARGYDLMPSTPQQIHLQRLLGAPEPAYAHFPLFCAPDGRRLAKRDRDAAYGELLAAYGSPQAVLGHVAYAGGLQEADEPATPEELLASFDERRMRGRYRGVVSVEYR